MPRFIVGAVLALLALAALQLPNGPEAVPVPAGHGAAIHAATAMPVSLTTAASTALGASERRFWPASRGSTLITRGGGIHTTFSASGASLGVARGTVDLSLLGVGRGQQIGRLAPVAPSGTGNEVVYRHGLLSEFFRNGPYGLEQGFTLRHRPGVGARSVIVVLRVGGSLSPAEAGSQVVFRTATGSTALRYGQLSALDATGRHLPAHMRLVNGTLQLRIDDRHARYPLRIDPFIQQGSALTEGSTLENHAFGSSVALSADGKTALIGDRGESHGTGAVWVFTRSGPASPYVQQERLTGGSESGKGEFGYSVGLSADGNTALIGGGGDANLAGAAWVLTRSGFGASYSQQEKLTGGSESGQGRFGLSVALSADGNTALIGGPEDNAFVGATWVFTRTGFGAPYAQQAKLAGSGGSDQSGFGTALALSTDGNIALIGGPYDNNTVGAAWVFTRSGSGSAYVEQEKLVGTGGIVSPKFGASVALSAVGNTALVGGSFDNNLVGAAWVFTRSTFGSPYVQQEKLLGNGAISPPQFGESVSLSADGNTALIGGNHDNAVTGAGWLFARAAFGSAYANQEKLIGDGALPGGEFGLSLVLSADGNTALIAAPYQPNSAHTRANGAVWMFLATPDWYKQNVRVGAGAVPVSSAGALVLQALGSSIKCKLVDVDEIWNPASGGAGEDTVAAFALNSCKSKPALCPAPEHTELKPVALPWSSVLVTGSTVRDELKGVDLEVRCSNTGFLDRFEGTLTPVVGNGLLEFGGTGSGTLHDGSGNQATLTGRDKLKAPPGKITAKQ